MTSADELIEALEDAGFYDHRPYSGRGMFGAECVGLDLEGEGDLWNVAYALGKSGADIKAPRVDSMGRGIIAYWPSVKWPENA